jgi:hypothetical protein
MEKCIILDSKKHKTLRSKSVNFDFDKTNGYMATWGKTKQDDPDWSPYGPFILDIEVTTICKGPNGVLCPWCYKSNTPNGTNMSFDTFKTIIDKFPKTLTQVAFGADAQGTANPDLFKMMDYCREIGVIPNITVADISDETADELVKRVGAVSVSRYADKNVCYDSIKKLTDRGLDQCNMHYMICSETKDGLYETLKDIKTDSRLAKLNAIVILSLKQKGRGVGFTPITNDEFKNIVDKAFELGISFGFDSCGANKFIESVKGRDNFEELKMCAEPCESAGFSSYIDTNGDFYPCSFAEGGDGWKDGISVLNCTDYIKDIWNHPRTKEFREKIIGCGRNCFLYNV